MSTTKIEIIKIIQKQGFKKYNEHSGYEVWRCDFSEDTFLPEEWWFPIEECHTENILHYEAGATEPNQVYDKVELQAD